MSRIFISYRRDDSEYLAYQLKEKVAERFGHDSVVFDIDSIPLGIDFRDHIITEVERCDVLLAVIGNSWLEILTQRLGDSKDFVRIEIEAALQRDIPVVPVLVGRAGVPSEEELPPGVASLAYRNAAEVRAGKDLVAHLDRLTDGLAEFLAVSNRQEDGPDLEAGGGPAQLPDSVPGPDEPEAHHAAGEVAERVISDPAPESEDHAAPLVAEPGAAAAAPLAHGATGVERAKLDPGAMPAQPPEPDQAQSAGVMAAAEPAARSPTPGSSPIVAQASGPPTSGPPKGLLMAGGALAVLIVGLSIIAILSLDSGSEPQAVVLDERVVAEPTATAAEPTAKAVDPTAAPTVAALVPEPQPEPDDPPLDSQTDLGDLLLPDFQTHPDDLPLAPATFHLVGAWEGQVGCLESNDPAEGGSYLYSCENVSGQAWSLEFVDGYYLLRSLYQGPDKCLEGNDPDSPAFGGASFMSDCANVTGQAWLLETVEPFVVLRTLFQGPDKCLQADDSQYVYLAPCDGDAPQLWEIVPD